MENHRQIHLSGDGSWRVWCGKHGKRYTLTIVATEQQAVQWWRDHTSSVKGPAMCPQRAFLPFNPFEGI